MSDHDRPKYAADFVAFSTDDHGVPHVALIKRKKNPHAGSWALPGGHVDGPHESSRTAAVRELAEETGLDASTTTASQVGVFDTPGRDARGWYVAVVYTDFLPGMPPIFAADDAADARWFPLASVNTATPLAFDHMDMIEAAAAVLIQNRPDLADSITDALRRS
ncbi:NUDIX domain-containing protein [Amycolatopsis keratiniphila]|uniref:Nudix hydrolase domain-containing protein n=1 Tax=Amycolatopsis keratiniphila subsp. keratiniphila TaxID=227715 RepID=A0A1W2M247_9PSEU|nr:NUDIX hydrolase [Amycolatopsis keratiniphila]ONF73931.1 hypothetical protein AVR91_0204160 [Amycolatopsis keratiniphila subsp. keratiniphila]